ncbi:MULTISPECIES: Pls/PosA family non-ribosomal peptide synthetase [unclassified Neorhizobium]|uniref:Pls/PosA family non-ribosomal peptide synthetase n=1 Tax=unclassified Neorhizobium TaxID=2629175 RepID=UPI001FF38BBE|nr:MULTISPECIES: Pls/PosA family non-ribosomal peptide synthetase [unclassified Neorhizobium]MCJ9668606.1 amino acid adenylation domain-containing protein [Neorhizobium sp. SHOUNA12B]MCJ9743870.1 amino acid adenylation domain-containing protein [Neorhizobium sp. SHOUNA12A]
MNDAGIHVRGLNSGHSEVTERGAVPQILCGPDPRNVSLPGERLSSLFERCAERYGAMPAVIDGGRMWTYIEIDAEANRLARLLALRGVKPGDRVALLLERSAETYMAILAVMKLGAAFVPLAAAFPEERMSLIIEDAGVRFVVTMAEHVARAAALSVPHIVIAANCPETARQSDSPLNIVGSDDDICYILYTSGTTGRPKGVAVRHQSICNFVDVAAAAYGYRPGDRVYQGMTIAFDFSTEEIWVPFVAGATIVPAPGRMTLVGEELGDFLRANAITCMACSPTLLSSLESDVPSLHTILVGGEACPQNLVTRWSKPGRRILNTYGPTEATVTATMGYLTPERRVTIGSPLPSYSIVILDAEAPRLAAAGEFGEIGIAGIGLAVGYLNRPDLTAQKFIPDFLDLPNNPSKRIYRTGDLGCINTDGEIEYHGRIDTQVKIRGYRIELGEIETALLDQPDIAQAAVTTWEVEPGRLELVGYYALKSGTGTLSRAHLAKELRRRLPEYMVPSFLEELAALPMTVSDKVDTGRLPKPMGLRVSTGRKEVLPSTDDESYLVVALGEVLMMDDISVEDHFFDDLGANSLLMARFCARLRARQEWSGTSMRDIYLNPTVAALARHLRGPEDKAIPVEEPVINHRASNLAYWTSGAAQLAFYCLFGYFDLWMLNYGLNWVYDMLDDPVQLYLRCAMLSAAVFFGMSGFAVAMKWLLIGRWKAESFPIWGLRYYRFWVVKTLIRSAPVVLFRGSPLYNLYLRLLGARLGRNATIESRTIPVCTDLISIGDNAILRKESMILGYRAQAGYIHTGSISIGCDAFVGVGSVIDIDTSVGERAQLGHASSLQRGEHIPDDAHWHGSPAIPTTADYCKAPTLSLSKTRRFSYEAVQLITLFAVVTPFPLWFHSYWQNVSDDYQESIGIVAVGTTVTLFALTSALLFVALVLPRLFSLLLKPGRTYRLYGFHFWLQSIVEASTNARFLNLIFGDSSAIVHYMRALGWKLNKVVQTGSNFGSNQQQDNPLFCEIGSGTMVSDGLYMINVHKSASAFRLEHTKVGERNYFGNNIFYPPDSRTGDNVLLGTKVMVPIDGPLRENVGLLGSPPFEIPRIVKRDKELIQGVSDAERRGCLPHKNRHNLTTALMFIATQWTVLFITLAIWDRALNYYTEWAQMALFVAVVLTAAFAIPFHIFLEWASLRFRKLQPQMNTIYDVAFWRHERHWKLSDSPVVQLFAGTPFRPMILRALGVKIGRRVYDGGANLTERSLVEIGDDATLNEGCVIQAHSLEEGAFKSDFIRIGNGCTLGPAAFIHYGVTMGDGALADVDCFVMKGEILQPNSIWRGNPAKPGGFLKSVAGK